MTTLPGISRIIQRTCAAINELKTDDRARLRAAGVIDLPRLQRYLNFHFSVTIDLFGADESQAMGTRSVGSGQAFRNPHPCAVDAGVLKMVLCGGGERRVWHGGVGGSPPTR